MGPRTRGGEQETPGGLRSFHYLGGFAKLQGTQEATFGRLAGTKKKRRASRQAPTQTEPKEWWGEEGKGEKPKDLIRDTRCNISKTIVFRERSDPLARSELWA